MILDWKNFLLLEKKSFNGGIVILENRFWKILRFDEKNSMRNAALKFNAIWSSEKFLHITSEWENYRSKKTPYLIFDQEKIKPQYNTWNQNINQLQINLHEHSIIRIDVIKKHKALIYDLNGKLMNSWPMLKQFGKYLKYSPISYQNYLA